MLVRSIGLFTLNKFGVLLYFIFFLTVAIFLTFFCAPPPLLNLDSNHLIFPHRSFSYFPSHWRFSCFKFWKSVLGWNFCIFYHLLITCKGIFFVTFFTLFDCCLHFLALNAAKLFIALSHITHQVQVWKPQWGREKRSVKHTRLEHGSPAISQTKTWKNTSFSLI